MNTSFIERRNLLIEQHRRVVTMPNEVDASWTNGVWQRYINPVVTAEHVPVHWRYDLDPERNPYLLERLGINGVCNSGAILFEDRFYLVTRTEGYDRKSFFALACSENGIDNFHFVGQPLVIPETDQRDTNMYDMRLISHEDGWIYGIFCAERRDPEAGPCDQSSAVASAGIARTRNLIDWERLPDLQTPSPQQRNVVLHPTFVDGQYMFYTRPMDGFIDTGRGSGICYGLCASMEKPVISSEELIEDRRYHTVAEVKNGQGPAPLKTDHGWLHCAHGVRNTAAGLRYVLYMFLTDLAEPWRVIARPGGHVLGPRAEERVGDVSNVLFTNGWIQQGDEVYLYYASADTRMHVATSTIDKLVDYCLHTPSDPLFSADCVSQRNELIERNLRFMAGN